MNIAINTHMTLKHTRTLRTWFIFDELAALHQLPALERGMQTARSFGGAFVLGLHNFAGLRKAYGDDGAQNIVSLANTSLMLRVKDRETAQECSDLIGFRKVRTMDEAYSYGAHQTCDASTISPTTKEEALIADDITSLPNLQGYIRFPEVFHPPCLQSPTSASLQLPKALSKQIRRQCSPRPTTTMVTMKVKRVAGPISQTGSLRIVPWLQPAAQRDHIEASTLQLRTFGRICQTTFAGSSTPFAAGLR